MDQLISTQWAFNVSHIDRLPALPFGLRLNASFGARPTMAELFMTLPHQPDWYLCDVSTVPVNRADPIECTSCDHAPPIDTFVYLDRANVGRRRILCRDCFILDGRRMNLPPPDAGVAGTTQSYLLLPNRFDEGNQDDANMTYHLPSFSFSHYGTAHHALYCLYTERHELISRGSLPVTLHEQVMHTLMSILIDREMRLALRGKRLEDLPLLDGAT